MSRAGEAATPETPRLEWADRGGRDLVVCTCVRARAARRKHLRDGERVKRHPCRAAVNAHTRAHTDSWRQLAVQGRGDNSLLFSQVNV